MAASSSSPQDPTNPPPPPAPPSSSTVSRRLPPPCWSHDETIALIDAYREKWYSLRRGNLRASHWQEVAEDVAFRCPLSGSPQKTSVQCRHKMEKLRKRYRAEVQRAASTPNGRLRYTSAWVHFNRMDDMERGPTAVAVPLNTTVPIDEEEDDDDDDDDDEDDDEDYQGKFYPKSLKSSSSNSRALYGSMSNGNNGHGFRIRIPGRSNMVPLPPPPKAKNYNKFDEYSTPSPNPMPSFGGSKGFRDGGMGRFGMGKSGSGVESESVGKRKESDPAAELAEAIKVLGDGFVRMERMKMEMAREVEAMRMEMEVKRTQMILESQQRIVESFAKAISERRNKKAKRMPSPES